MNINRRIIVVITLVISLFTIGTAGYVLLEGWPILDAFYMTVISLTTVGFSEVAPLSDAGQMFTIVLLLLGVSTLTYGLTTVIEYLITARLGIQMRKRRMLQTIKKYENHVIVCGHGRVGQSAIETLAESQRQVVVIEREPETAVALLEAGQAVVEGDATSDDVLQSAGIERAWGLIVTTGDDSSNLFIVLSARALNPNLYIVTRSASANESKMIRAGANRIVSPYRIGGRHMANIIIRPHVTDFFDVVTLSGGLELWIEELVIAPDASLVNQTVGKADIRRQTGATMVALIRASDGKTLMPDADTPLQPGDELIVLGTREQLTALQMLTGNVLKR